MVTHGFTGYTWFHWLHEVTWFHKVPHGSNGGNFRYVINAVWLGDLDNARDLDANLDDGNFRENKSTKDLYAWESNLRPPGHFGCTLTN